MAGGRPKAAGRQPDTTNQRFGFRAAITNGTQLHVKSVNGNSAPARRWRDLYNIVFEAASQRIGEPTEAQRQLVRRAASLCVLAELLDAKLASGEYVAPKRYVEVTTALTRTLVRLGLARELNGDNNEQMAPLDDADDPMDALRQYLQ